MVPSTNEETEENEAAMGERMESKWEERGPGIMTLRDWMAPGARGPFGLLEGLRKAEGTVLTTEEWPPKVTETPKSESVSEVANGERRSVTFAAGKGISEKAFAPAAGPSSSSSQAGPSAERL